MCFGSGAPKYEKPDFGELPSLKQDEKVEREGAQMTDVKRTGMRTGMQPLSLLTLKKTK